MDTSAPGSSAGYSWGRRQNTDREQLSALRFGKDTTIVLSTMEHSETSKPDNHSHLSLDDIRDKKGVLVEREVHVV